MSHYKLFRQEHCHTAKYEAQRQLSGITHYVDDDTLKYFECRVLEVVFAEDGLTLGLITSQPNPMTREREYRAIMFNVFGHVYPASREYTTCTNKKESLEVLKDLMTNPQQRYAIPLSIKSWIKHSAESHKLQAASESKYIIDLL